MKFGMPTLIEFNSIEENIELAKALNLDFIELNLDLPYCNLPGTELLDLSNKYNIEFTAHLSEKLDVAELDNDLRLAYLNKIEKIIISSNFIHSNKTILFFFLNNLFL